MRVLFIACIFFTAPNLFGQTSHASISAMVVNPVGAEIGGDINNVENSSTQKIPATDKGIDNEKQISFLKIIGETFSHQVIMENINTSKTENKETGDLLSERKKKLRVSVTVYFD